MNKRSVLVVLLVAVGSLSGVARRAASPEARVDAVLSKWSATTPGCAIGVSLKGKSVIEKVRGMADLEHDVPIRPDTIFEAGSVSKQFTAAAVLLLARDGKLALDDQARTYVPELPDYGAPLTIRHMLNHTSGRAIRTATLVTTLPPSSSRESADSRSPSSPARASSHRSG